mgnify:FL=1
MTRETDNKFGMSDMITPIDELKVQAKKLLKNTDLAKIIPLSANTPHQLKHTQLYLARQLGFTDWAHAKSILSCDYDLEAQNEIQAETQLQFGSLWHSRKCDTLLNTWCRNYQEAKQVQSDSGGIILPYKSQFILATADYFTALNIPFEQERWQQINNNWCTGDKQIRQQLLLPILIQARQTE